MTNRNTGATWNPRPRPDFNEAERRAYGQGYLDGFQMKSLDAAVLPAEPYTLGYEQGSTDSEDGA